MVAFVGKYDAWDSFFARIEGSAVEFRFDELEAVIDSRLPGSAYSYPSWWRGHQNARWVRHGWKAFPNLHRRTVHFVKRSPARYLFRSNWFRYLDTGRHKALARRAAGSQPDLFSDVQAFTLFVGHNKSGTSLLGSLLDAHPKMIVSDEADALRFVVAGLSRDQIFHVLHRASRSEARKGRVTARRLGGYSYYVSGQWQGRINAPRLVGDSMSGTTTRKFGQDPALIETVSGMLEEIELKLLHVIRNPFDPITLMMIRGGRSFENSISHYFDACANLMTIRETVDPERLLPVYYENLATNPREELQTVCRYLGVDTDADYLSACARMVSPPQQHSRHRLQWTEEWISEVEGRIADYEFLAGYTFAEFGRSDG